MLSGKKVQHTFWCTAPSCKINLCGGVFFVVDQISGKLNELRQKCGILVFVLDFAVETAKIYALDIAR